MPHVADSRFAILTPEAVLTARIRDEVARHWKLVLAIGIVSILAGAFSILVPVVASISVAILIGWVLLVSGIVQLAHAFRGSGWHIAWNVAVAVVTAIAGLWILLAPLSGTITLTVVLVAWLWFSGAMRLATWWPVRHLEGSWLLLLSGLVNLLVGLLIWADLPSSAAWAIGLLVGISLLFTGTDLVMTALAGREFATSR
jgi:uncharacterized membrane protein HdeD (DUF308 family)